MQSPYDWLIQKLDAFIRRYYLNQIIRGFGVMVTGLLAYILVVSLGEYFLFLPVWVRISLWVLFGVSLAAALFGWIIRPILRMARLDRRGMSYDEAARIIGRHFPEINDRLLNLLQLRSQQPMDQESGALLEAAIEQNARKVLVFPLHRAVDFSVHRRILPYLLPLVFIFAAVLILSPRIFIDASQRLMAPATVFEKPAPFRFILEPTPLRAIRGEDFRLKVLTEGKLRPKDMILDIRGEQIAMRAEGEAFVYTFRQIRESLDFRLLGAGYYSGLHRLEVISRPAFADWQLKLDFPAHTKMPSETHQARTDLQVPEGTRLSLQFTVHHSDQVGWEGPQGALVPLEKKNGLYRWKTVLRDDTLYRLVLGNREHGLQESYPIEVRVIPDQYPQLEAREYRDSLSGKQILVEGTAGDDYGLTRGQFVYEIYGQGEKPVRRETQALPIHQGLVSRFHHYLDLDALDLEKGQKVNFYVEVWDNDGVRGPKSTRSSVMSYHMLDAAQLDSAIQENSQRAGASISEGARQNKQMKESLDALSSELLQSPRMDWEQEQSLQTLAKLQEEMRASLEKTRRHLEEQIQQTRQREFSESLDEKQQQVKKQLDEMIDKELAEQMERLKELMKQVNREQAFQAMEEMKQENRLFEMNMERIQELLAQLEQQIRLEDLSREFSQMAQKQDSLRESSSPRTEDLARDQKEQEALRDALEKALNEELDQARQAAEAQQRSLEERALKEAQQQGEETVKEMNKASEKLDKGDQEGASPAQSKASENLRKMAASMQSMAQGMNVQQIQIDIQATRMILSNLIRVSFDQEDLMDAVRRTPTSSPRYLENLKKQHQLRQQSRMIRDSLFALSKRVAQLAPTVNKETTELEYALSSAVSVLEERNLGEGMKHQQYAMMHTNNLALMLHDLLSNLLQMQAQAQAQPGAEGLCTKPGGKQPKPGAGEQLADIITDQEDLGDAMEQMQRARRPGSTGKSGESESPSSAEDGKQGGQRGQENQGGESEALARMAARQAEIRRRIAELSRELNSKGMGQGERLQEIMQEMDRQETDLVNRQIYAQQFLARQKQILTRLLEAEKAVREQEQSDQRSGQSARDQKAPMPPELEQFLKDRQHMQEAFRWVPAHLKPYYRKMVEDYYQLIGQDRSRP